jgi:hypothetical protein
LSKSSKVTFESGIQLLGAKLKLGAIEILGNKLGEEVGPRLSLGAVEGKTLGTELSLGAIEGETLGTELKLGKILGEPLG